jgi:hypothetical protein
VLLYELLAFLGDLDRVRRQFEPIQYQEPERDAAVQVYCIDHRERGRRESGKGGAEKGTS